jgi:hypothetical protein
MLVSSPSAIRLSLQPSTRVRHVGLQQDAGLCQQLGGTLTFVDQVLELSAFVRDQPQNVFLDGQSLSRPRITPLAGVPGGDSENRVRLNDVRH